MDFLGPILEVVKIIGAPIGKCVKYHRTINENMKILESELDKLNRQTNDIESILRTAECCPGKKPKEEVTHWLGNVQSINREKQAIEQKVRIVKYLFRARLGKLIDEKIQEVKKLHLEGSSFGSFVVDAPPRTGVTLSTTTLVGETTTKGTVDKIWAYLMDDEIRKIGIYGMGGVGKTTIMKDIHNRLLKATDKFDHVILVTVSNELDVIKLQNNIASALEQDLSKHEDKTTKAGLLLEILRTKKRFVLILDDMWEIFFFEDIGIPEPTTTNGCKLVLTTRSLDVCRQMGCKEVKAECLSNGEAWELFSEKVDLDVSHYQYLEATVKLVAEECSGLPLAIVTIACSMRGVYDIREWENALNELRGCLKGVKGTEREVFGRLEFSYNRLKSLEVKQCFLYCALYPEDFKIERKMLIDYWVAEGLIDKMDSMQAEFYKGHAIINTLVNSCLLESTDYEQRVTMHDLIRDMALNITRVSPRFLVKAGMQLRELPNEQDWTEDLEKASLMDNSISEIPSDMSPKCPRLSTLILRENHRLVRISDSFFVHMHALQVLDLSFTDIKHLPNSISDLESLTALLLRGCRQLRYVPSLAKLRALRKLDLSLTAIKQVPHGMELLVNLRWLSLYAEYLEMLSAGILPKLSRLQYLVLFWRSKKVAVRREELMSLRQLETIAGQFYELCDLNEYTRSLPHKGLKLSNYLLQVGILSSDHYDSFYEFGKEVRLSRCSLNREGEDPLVFPIGIQTLKTEECHFVNSCLWDLLSLAPNSATDLKSCYISDCDGIECVLSSSSLVQELQEVKEEKSCCIPLRRLERLELRVLPDLSALFKGGGGVAPPQGTLSSLKDLRIYSCSKIKKLFPLRLLQHLHNLEKIIVFNCLQMEEIIAEEEGEGGIGESSNHSSSTDYNNEITLPKLRRLNLWGLPELKSIYRGKMACDSIREIGVIYCPKLKRHPLSLPLIDGQLSPPPTLRRISATDPECWESLEWDHPNAKNVLQPYVKLMNEMPGHQI